MNCFLCEQPAELKREPHSYFSTHVFCPRCGEYYMEPVYRSMLETLKEYYTQATYNLVINEMQTRIKTYGLVVFTGNADIPLTHLEGPIFFEIHDILNALHLNIQNNSEKGDYGD